MDHRDIRIIQNMYIGQKAVIRIENIMSEEIEIKRGARQGYILSPILFNLYLDDIVNKALDEQNIRIKVSNFS